MADSADELVSFYDGDSTKVLISTVVFGFAVLCLLWFAAALANSIAGSGDDGVTSALNDVNWALMSMGWFPIAMLVMAGSFGLWRAGIFSTETSRRA